MNTLRRIADVATITCLIVVGIVIGKRFLTGQVGLASVNEPAASEAPALSPAGIPLSRGTRYELAQGGVLVGDSRPATTIITYMSYSCSWCARLDSSLTVLLQRYPDHLAVAYKDFVTDSLGDELYIHAAARCAAAQGAFLSYNRVVYQNPEVASGRDGWRRAASLAGVPKPDELVDCVLRDSQAGRVMADSREAHRLGFTATPALIIGDKAFEGNVPLFMLDSLVAMQISAATRRNRP